MNELKKDNPGYPEKSWIYNTNILEVQTSCITTWLLTPLNRDSFSIMGISNIDDLYEYSCNFAILNNAIQPVLYLKSSIQILSGNGSKQKKNLCFI